VQRSAHVSFTNLLDCINPHIFFDVLAFVLLFSFRVSVKPILFCREQGPCRILIIDSLSSDCSVPAEEKKTSLTLRASRTRNTSYYEWLHVDVSTDMNHVVADIIRQLTEATQYEVLHSQLSVSQTIAVADPTFSICCHRDFLRV